MKVIEVDSKQIPFPFFQAAYLIYSPFPNYIPPVEEDIKQVLNPTKNPYLLDCFLKIYLAFDEKGTPIGRVVAWIKKGTEKGEIGFFESINNDQVANLLFKTAIDFLKNKGANHILGSISPGSRDKYWGVLKDENYSPTFQENYNPAYYNDLFLNFGFVVDFQQYTYSILYKNFNKERIFPIADRIMKSNNMVVKPLDFKQKEQFVKDFVEIYNQAWSDFDFFKPVTEKEIIQEFESLKQIAIPEIMLFAYIDGNPAGFIISIPDINFIFNKIGSKFHLFNKLRFLWYLKTKNPKTVKGIVFGVVPKYHNKGIESALIYSAYDSFQKHIPFIENIELAWIGSFNPKMNKLMTAIGAVAYKIHQVYRLDL